jgi:hypothetical protein
MPIEAKAFALAFLAFATSAAVARAAPPALTIDLSGRPEPIFAVAQNPCADYTQPDIHARAFRNAAGKTVMFGLDQSNRPFVGASLGTAKLDCRSALSSGENADPAAFDGRRYLAATWTNDGTHVAGLVHDEYHADTHPGRCAGKGELACWYNAIIAVRSGDGGMNFAPASPLVVAAPPFKQDVDQTRHRGFFNPSNMFAGPGGVYIFAATTGWDRQTPGACLLRNADPLNSAGWRGWNGHSFATRWSNPYATAHPDIASCQPIKPFGLPVASVVRHRPSGLYLAIWEQMKVAAADWTEEFSVAGFYLATSRDLRNWSEPRLFLPTQTVHQPCGAHDENKDGSILAYPSLLDENAKGRNYDDVGDSAWLYVTRIALDGCNPATRRVLVRQKILIRAAQ